MRASPHKVQSVGELPLSTDVGREPVGTVREVRGGEGR